MHGPINIKSPNNTSKWQVGFNSTFIGLIYIVHLVGYFHSFITMHGFMNVNRMFYVFSQNVTFLARMLLPTTDSAVISNLLNFKVKILLHFFNLRDIINGSVCTLERSVFQGLIIKNMLK
jgi:hypothetical protein